MPAHVISAPDCALPEHSAVPIGSAAIFSDTHHRLIGLQFWRALLHLNCMTYFLKRPLPRAVGNPGRALVGGGSWLSHSEGDIAVGRG